MEMKRTNMKTAMLSTMVVASLFACAPAFAAEDTAAATTEATAKETTASEAKAPAAEAPAAQKAAATGDVFFRLDDGTYVEIRDVYGNLIKVPAAEVNPEMKQTEPVAIFGGVLPTIHSKNLDKK